MISNTVSLATGSKILLPELRIAESLTKEKSAILSYSTVYFRFSVPLEGGL